MNDLTTDHVMLNTVVTTLDTAVVDVQHEDSGSLTDEVASVALVDAADLPGVSADLLFLTGDAATAFPHLMSAADTAAPVAVAVREAALTHRASSAILSAGCTLIILDSRARWDVLLPRVQRLLSSGSALSSSGHGAASTSLDELAVLLADDVGGLVTIEDSANRILAYSPSLSAADDIRARAILGREATAPVMDFFSTWDVVDTITRTTEAVRVPADPSLAMAGRLIVGIHRSDGLLIGSIWVQEGPSGFTEDAVEVLRGGAVTAASILQRLTDGSNQEDAVLHRLFGEHGDAAAAALAADMLRVSVEDSAMVVGIATQNAAADEGALLSTVKRLRIHIGALWSDARTTLIRRRIYLLLPRTRGGSDITVWTQQLLERFDDQEPVRALSLRAAIASVSGFGAGVPQARREVDRVLDSPAQTVRVTSFEQSRTTVLLGEVVAHLSPEVLADPRLDAIFDYDANHGTELVESLRVYLRSGENMREAARLLTLHPNTLRYRISRVEALSGLDLRDPDDRLLTEVGLLVRG